MPADLETADEVFITSTTRDLLPVLEIEGAKVGRTLAAQTALAAAFHARLRQYVAEHKPAPAARV